MFVFVGTSFSVTLTQLVVKEAQQRGRRIFNFNVDAYPKQAAKPTLRWLDVTGRAEETLPLLAAAVSLRVAL